MKILMQFARDLIELTRWCYICQRHTVHTSEMVGKINEKITCTVCRSSNTYTTG